MSLRRPSSERIRSIFNTPAEPGMEFIAEPRDYEKEIIDGEVMEVVTYGVPSIDKWCPAKMGELTCIIGHTNVGKTTAIMWMLSKLAKKQKKILVYSAENRISRLHKAYTKFFTGKEQVTIDELQYVRETIRYIKHEKHFSYRDMLNQGTFLLDAGFEFDFFLVDPYNSLKIDNKERLNTHDYHYQAAEEMRIFTTTTDKSIFLNCHTVTEAQRVKPDQDGHRPAPLDSDVEGGGKFPNKADNTIVLHRQISSNIPDEKFITEIHVRKVRNQEFGGEPTPFTEPIKIKFRKDRTGFDELYSTEQKLQDYKQMSYLD